MSVIPLTIFFSLLLAGLFIVLFANEQRRRRFASAESDSLLPLADEIPLEVGGVAPLDHEHVHEHADHDHADNCGCKSGKRNPCAGCLKRSDAAAPSL